MRDAFADIDGLAFAAMRGLMLHEAEEHGLEVPENTETRLSVKTEIGKFGITDRPGNGLRLDISAERQEDLFVLRDALVGHIEHYLPDVAADIRWSDKVVSGGRPPNFQFAEVRTVASISTDFLRMTLAPEHLEGFSETAIHLRFMLPHPQDADPDWPTLAENGATRWPKGEKALHRPVYTVRAQRLGEIDVDIYLHEGGQVRDWAEAAQPGDKVALLGPGGGGMGNIETIVLAGDETAYPAISRILETLPDTAVGQIVLLSHSGARDYPLASHPNLAVEWATAGSFVDAITQAADKYSEPFVWVGAEASEVAALRECAALADLPKTSKYLAAYWTRGKAAP